MRPMTSDSARWRELMVGSFLCGVETAGRPRLLGSAGRVMTASLVLRDDVGANRQQHGWTPSSARRIASGKACIYTEVETEHLMSDKIPVTVLTGYLGAGKTTLLNRILSEPHGQKYAVIVNEFGEIGIDNDLIVGADEEIFEMNNGCICCTVRGDLIRIIQGLMRRKGKFDAIIVETTGLADPAP